MLEARNGIQTKETVTRARPDLVILDMMMPGLGGFPVPEHYRDRAGRPAFIMITANEGSRHKAYAALLGAADYIRKPFALERLLESVEKALGGES